LIDVTVEHAAVQRFQQKAYDVTLLQEREALLNRQLEAANAALRATQVELESSQAELLRVHDRLQGELAEAAGYVSSLLPAPMTEPFTADWYFVPSTELGGDALGYHWIDPDHFALYLLDVCGHGIGPSLLSVAILHVLQSGSLRGTDFRNPGQVLGALNDLYQMQSSTDLYFTMWYGVFQPSCRRLEFGCAGHPAAVLVEPGRGSAQLLKPQGLPVGLLPGAAYSCEQLIIPEQRLLYLLSDGAFEVERADGSMLKFGEFVSLLTQLGAGEGTMAALYRRLVELRGKDRLEDDFTIARFGF
jgi:serine phosphatase RsbU (regulator of sigma subunit)